MPSEKLEAQPIPAPVAGTESDFFDLQKGKFFRRVDWLAFWITLLVSFSAYFYTMAPTVTLEDSGELAVASDYLGVPHPPGYPIWTLVTWFFQWIFHWVKYYGVPDSNLMLVVKSLKDLFDPSMTGHPNPAWSVGMASAFFGALACGLLAILVSRSGADILRCLARETALLGRQTEAALCLAAGVTGGLLFAFSSVLWSQSTIVEVYSLNAFFMVLVLLLTYRWMCRPHEDYVLYITAFSFGLGLTNHQSLLFLGPALLGAIWYRDRDLFRDCIAGLFWLIAGILFYKVWKIGGNVSPEALKDKQMMFTVGLLFAAAPIGLFLIERKIMTEWKRFLIAAAAAFLGISFYFGYLPVSSEQNPPMNWGYPRTVEGFWHAVSRGQYEKISPADNIRDAIAHPENFPMLVYDIVFKPADFTSVVSQFEVPVCIPVVLMLTLLVTSSLAGSVRRKTATLIIAASAVIGFLAIYRIRAAGFNLDWLFLTWVLGLLGLYVPTKLDRRSVGWLVVTVIAFVFMTFVFIIFQYPKRDVQTLFIGRVQYIQAHAIFALWISYGLIFAMTFLDSLLKGRKAVMYGGCAAMLLLPVIPVWNNAYNERYLKIVGGAEQNEHDFGWQFGAWQLEGARAILSEISEEEKASYPTPDYPPPMETNAVFFGGTDPGRFVPTYMIYSAHYREDVYLITQNALADNTYMNVMRDLYGDRIWIPSQQDSNFAFQKYVQDVQAGRISAGADVSFEGGRVSVQGVQGVMMINGILARMIFEANKDQHAFYVEESYVIPWMYPYLEPHGLIMKINREPMPQLSPEVVENDRKFWDWYAKRLMDNPKFRRDVVACKTFSKLRSAIAGLYVARRLFPEAEYAFKQAIDLYPLSPEANFRLADVYMQQFRFTEARTIIEDFLKEDPDNDKVAEFLTQIKDLESSDKRRRELEQTLSQGGDVNAALELAGIYRKMNLMQLFESLCMNIINQGGIPPQIILQVGQTFADIRRFDLLATALTKYLEREPGNAKIWVDLSAVQAHLQRPPEAMASLKKAIELGGEPVREMARKDNRFDSIRETPEFKQLVPPMQSLLEAPLNMNLPGL